MRALQTMRVVVTGAGSGPGRATAVIEFLLSPGASFMTGATVPVDGGDTAVGRLPGQEQVRNRSGASAAWPAARAR